MKKLILTICLFCSLCLADSKTDLQKKIIKAALPYDLAYTLLAIVEVETGTGLLRVNLQDPSCGVTMIHIKYYMQRYKLKDTPFNRNYHCQKLIDNDDLAISEALSVLNFWKARFCNKWGCTSEQYTRLYSAYNTGYNNTLESILETIKMTLR